MIKLIDILKEVLKGTNQAPYGVIFFSNNKALVGDMHQKPIELSNDLIEKIVKIANTYGYYGEGIGLEYNKAVTEASFFDRLDPKKNKGSWDKKLIKSKEIPKDQEYVFLYALFSNPKENNRLGKLLKSTKKGDTIFDVLLKTIPDWSAEMGEFHLGENDLKRFLKECSEHGINFLELSKQEANEKTLSDFLDKGEKLQWPEDWAEYPNKAGKFARTATTLRDLSLINAGPGVYFVGAGHLSDIAKMKESKGVKLIGGEKI